MKTEEFKQFIGNNEVTTKVYVWTDSIMSLRGGNLQNIFHKLKKI